jgi:hypothetical protein
MAKNPLSMGTNRKQKKILCGKNLVSLPLYTARKSHLWIPFLAIVVFENLT